MLRDVVDRIESRLKAVGKSATAASREAGLSEDAIRNLRRGATADEDKGVSTRTLEALAPVLQTTVSWLAGGLGDESLGPRLVKKVGFVGAGSEAHFYANGDDPDEWVEAPAHATPDTRASEIRGNSLGPIFDRWLVYWEDVRSPVTPDLFGQLCVVGLRNDQVLVKLLRPTQDPTRFHLISNGGEEPLYDQDVLWAAKVMEMRPKG